MVNLLLEIIEAKISYGSAGFVWAVALVMQSDVTRLQVYYDCPCERLERLDFVPISDWLTFEL